MIFNCTANIFFVGFIQMFSLEFSGELNIYFVGLDNTIHAFFINQIRSGKHYSSFLFSVQTNKGGCIFLFMFIAIASYG